MKTTRRTFQWIGVWVAVLPFLGFPTSWKKALSVLTGLAIVVVAYLYIRRGRTKIKQTEAVFIDSKMKNEETDELQAQKNTDSVTSEI